MSEYLLDVELLVEPVAKARARVIVSHGFSRAYTPTKTVNAEQMIIASLRAMNGNIKPIPQGLPVKLEVTFYIEKPKSLPKKLTMPVKRPDLDNYIKLILDSLNKYLIPDDSQVTTIVASKRFGSPPRIVLRVYEDDLD